MAILQQLRDVRIAIVALWSLVLTTTLIGGILSTEKVYCRTHPYYFDPAFYCLQGANLYQQLPTKGRWHLAWNEWLNETTHPLDTTIRLLFWPQTFRYPYGHLSVTAPILAVTLFLLAWTVFQRTGSLPYACAVTAFFCALPLFQDPYWGLGAYWLDPTAALLSSCAMLCLMNVKSRDSTLWLAAFSLFVALAALQRYIAVIYTAVVCGPILGWHLIQLSRIRGDFVKGGLLPIAAASLPAVLLAGPFLVWHFHINMTQYTSLGYALGHSVKEAFLTNLDLFGALWLSDRFFTSSVLALALLTLWFLASEKTPPWDSLLISLWLASAVLVFEIFILKAVGAPHTLTYAVPGMFFAIVSPAPMSYLNSKRLITVASCLIILVAAIYGTSLHTKAMWSAQQLDALPEKKFYTTIAKRLIELGGNRVSWASTFNECSALVDLEAFYRFRLLPFSEPTWSSLSIHESYYKRHFLHADPATVSEKVYDRLRKRTQIVLVFDDPAAVDRAGFDNEYTKSVARFAAEKVRLDTNVWQWLFSLDHKRFGRISGYRNLALAGSNAQ
jgi:hypothetical protein